MNNINRKVKLFFMIKNILISGEIQSKIMQKLQIIIKIIILPITNFNYELPITNYVELSIYNLLGQKVATLVKKYQEEYIQDNSIANGLNNRVLFLNLSTSIYLEQTGITQHTVIGKFEMNRLILIFGNNLTLCKNDSSRISYLSK